VTGPDDTPLSADEWEAVRRLRREQPVDADPAVAEPQPAAAVQPAAEPDLPAEPVPATEPVPAAETAEPQASYASLPATPTSATAATLRRAAVVALTGLVVAALAAVSLLAVVTVRLSDHYSRNSDANAALAAATSNVATVLSYNYKSLAADFAKAESALTPSFRKTYETTTAKAVEPLAAKYHAVSTAQVTSGGVISTGAARAQVVVFVSQQVTNTQLTAPRLDRSRIVVDLRRSNGRWLIDKLTPV
jgi:Mce-associated membrane protein